MKIFGIDPGSIVMGIGLIEVNERDEIVDSKAFVLRIRSSDTIDTRLISMYEGLSKILEYHEPEKVAVESPFVGQNRRTALVLGEVKGMVRAALQQKGLTPTFYSPRECKRATAGDGGADKFRVLQSVNSILGTGLTEYDMTDALAVAICHWNALRVKRVLATGTR